MTAQRASMLLAGATALMLVSGPATAQVSDGIVLNILRECAKIDDPTARLACYDNNIRAAGANPATAESGRAPVGGPGSPVPQRSAQGFGNEDVRVRSPQRFDKPADRVDTVRVKVAEVRPREPGIYLVTLEDGAQWLFTEGVARSFNAPRKGDSVEISRAALGSFLMRVGKQEPVRVERVR